MMGDAENRPIGTALITGVRGFIGRRLAEDLAGLGWLVEGVARSDDRGGESDPLASVHRATVGRDCLDEIVAKISPQMCFHTAGIASVARSFESPTEDFAASAVGTFALLESLRRFAPDCKVVILSSAAVYGEPVTLPINEQARIAPVSPYGWHKWLSEQIAREYVSLYGLQIVVARIFSAYGEGLRRQVLWDLCTKLTSDEEVVLNGPSESARDFLHVADVSRSLVLLAGRGAMDGRAYNVASGTETRISDIIEMLQESLGVRAKSVRFSPSSAAGTPVRWRGDISAIEALGFSPSVRIHHGVQEYARWWKRVCQTERGR